MQNKLEVGSLKSQEKWYLWYVYIRIRSIFSLLPLLILHPLNRYTPFLAWLYRTTRTRIPLIQQQRRSLGIIIILYYRRDVPVASMRAEFQIG